MLKEEEVQNLMEQDALQKFNTQTSQTQDMQYILEEKEKGMVELQLEVDSIKSEIYHLLKQDILKFHDSGKIDWIPIPDKKQRTLSDWGVERIMQVIHFYINKNTLLSNFSEEQINRLMLKFMRELNDQVLLKYQVLFREPTFEECKDIIKERVENKKKMKIFSLEVIGKKADEKKISDELMEEMEKTLEKEMIKIKDEQRKQKIRDYGIMLAQLEIIVYSCLNRAYRGEERGSFRRHTNISELVGSRPQQIPSSRGGIFSWGRK